MAKNTAIETLASLIDTADLGVYFSGLTLAQTRVMCEAVAHAAEIVTRSDRHTLAAAMSEAIINAGERADACRPGTATQTAHLARMALLDAAETACILPDCAPEYRAA